MLLLLVLYASPFLAVLLFWRTQRTVLALPAPVEAEAGSPWTTLRTAMTARIDLVRPGLGAFAALAALAALSAGAAAGVSVLVGAAMTGVVTALGSVARTPVASAMGGAQAWKDSLAAAVAEAAVVCGGIGVLALFFADPSGAPVLAAFALGAATAALFADIVVGATSSGGATTFLAPLRSHLATFCAALAMAATAPAEELLPLGGLLAETETLRSELLLLPVALVVLSPLVAAASSPLVAMLVDRKGVAGVDGAGRLATLLATVAMALVVSLTGLSWNLLLAYSVGLAAREAVFALETVTARASRLAGGPPAMLAPMAAAIAFCAAAEVAGGYGVAVAASAMTTTWVSSAASAAVSRALGEPAHDVAGAASADFSAALALLVATASAVVTQCARDGLAVEQVVVFAPSLLAGAVGGAAFGASLAGRFAEVEDEREAVAAASRAVVATAAAPLVGVILGPGGAVGVALGVLAAAAASSRPGPSRGGPVALAWATTAAMATLVAVPLMV